MKYSPSIFKKLMFKMAKEAGKIQMKYFRTDDIGIKIKQVYDSGVVDVVTKVDKLSEEKIIAIIKKSKMQCKIISEESEEINIGDSEYTWVIDPIDGTHTYAIGSSNFCIALALLMSEMPIMGLLYFPARNELYFAEKGKGAFLNDRKLNVPQETELSKSRIAFRDCPLEYDRKRAKEIYSRLADSVNEILAETGNFVMKDLALGEINGFVNIMHKFPVWDFIPGLIIAKEAGAVITDFNGNEITKETETFVAGNKIIHKKLLNIIK